MVSNLVQSLGQTLSIFELVKRHVLWEIKSVDREIRFVRITTGLKRIVLVAQEVTTETSWTCTSSHGRWDGDVRWHSGHTRTSELCQYGTERREVKLSFFPLIPGCPVSTR